MSESLLLKWGTLKGWHLTTEKSTAAFERYTKTGVEYNAMRWDTPEQKQLLCDLIDAIDGEIQNDWTGDMMTKDEAKEYVMNYRKAPVPRRRIEEARSADTATAEDQSANLTPNPPSNSSDSSE